MRIWIASFALVFSFSLNAQEEKLSYSLQEAQNYATDHAYEIIGSNYDLRMAQKKVWETIALGLPQVNTQANYNNNLDLQTSFLPGEIAGAEAGTLVPVTFGQQFTADATLSVSQLIFDGSYLVGVKASKIYTELAEDQREAVRIQVRSGVTQAYFYVLAAMENAKTLEENLASNQKLYEEAKYYYEEGLREETDVDQAKLLVSNSQNQLNDAKRSVETSYMTLKYLMGIDVEKEIDLTDKLEELIVYALLDEDENKYDLFQHIDYRILQTQFKAQELFVKNEKAGYLPKLNAFYNYGYNSSGDNWNLAKNDVDWYKFSSLGLKLTLPIFTSGQRHARVVQEEIALDQLGNKLRQTEQNLKKEVLLTQGELLKTRENYKNAQENLQLAKKIYDKTRFKYDEGVANSSELTQNEVQYIQAHTNFISSIIQLLQADVNYRNATGRL